MTSHITTHRGPSGLGSSRWGSRLLGLLLLSGVLCLGHGGCYVALQPLPGCDSTSQHALCGQDSGQTESPAPEPAPRCGDGTCQAPDEHYGSCPQDCPCANDQRCQEDTCQATARCGDGTCDDKQGENCTTCESDCACPKEQSCRQGQCLQQCACTPSQKRCQDGNIEICQPTCLGWDLVKSCQPPEKYYCEPLTWTCKCKQSCTEGQRGCISKTELEECVKDGECTIFKTQTCGKGETCVKGQCCECTPGETRCNGQTYDQTCGPDCKWKPKRSCKDNHPLSLCLTKKCI